MVLYFSGTGNSRYVAERVAKATGDTAVSLNDRLRLGPGEPFRSARPFVFVSPIYAWRIPKVVDALLRQARFEGAGQAYFLATCGSGGGDAGRYAKKLCVDKGLTFMGLQTIVMPENYLAMFPVPGPTAAAEILAAAEPSIHACARAIGAVQPLPALPRKPLDWIKSALMNPLFYAFCVSAKGFRTTEACTGCGRCARFCPLANISTENGKPLWGKHCTHCMACIARCPEEAIEYGHASEGQPRYWLDRAGRPG